MLFKVDSKKSELHGKKIFVPYFSSLRKKDRDTVSRFVGGCGEYEPPSLWGFVIGLAWIALTLLGMGTENKWLLTIALFILPGLFLLAIIGTFIWEMMDSLKEPHLDIPHVRTDFLSWKHLMMAFSDDFALWERLTNEIFVDHKSWELKYASKLSLRLSDAVSDYLSYKDLEANRDLIVHEVARIFSEYDAEQEELRQARLAREEAEANGARLVFEQQLQMAAEDIEYSRLNPLPTSSGMSI